MFEHTPDSIWLNLVMESQFYIINSAQDIHCPQHTYFSSVTQIAMQPPLDASPTLDFGFIRGLRLQVKLCVKGQCDLPTPKQPHALALKKKRKVFYSNVKLAKQCKIHNPMIF